MNDPRLSEFSKEELQVVLRLVMKEKKDLSGHLKEIERWNLQGTLQEQVDNFTLEIATLDLLFTQFMDALVDKGIKERIASN